MKKIFNILLLLALSSVVCQATDQIGQLVEISLYNQNNQQVNVGQTPFTVVIRSSDKEGFVEKKNGARPGIKETDFNLKDLKNFSFTVPWERWDGDATLHVKVFKEAELTSQVDLQDRGGKIFVQGRKNAQSTTITKNTRHACFNNQCSEPCSVKIKLNIDASGRLTADVLEYYDNNSSSTNGFCGNSSNNPWKD